MIFCEDGAIMIFSSDRKENSSQPRKKNARKSRKEIYFYVFETLKPFTKDPFWIDFLDKAKIGVFPKNFKFFEGFLTYKYRAKTRTFNLNEVNEECFENFKRFIFETVGIESPIDMEERIKRTPIGPEKALSFAKIKQTSSLLRCAICNYIDKFVRQYNFNMDDVAIFEATLYNKIICDQITAHDVVIKNNLIEDISGITFDEETRQVIFEEKLVRLGSKSNEDYTQTQTSLTNSTITIVSKKHKQTSILDDWEHYINKLLSTKKKKEN